MQLMNTLHQYYGDKKMLANRKLTLITKILAIKKLMYKLLSNLRLKDNLKSLIISS